MMTRERGSLTVGEHGSSGMLELETLGVFGGGRGGQLVVLGT